ncbi:DICT sensory domain-containing protein [Halorientalis salina]|uniref:DICT sensory domain-containing protein n=1 Tax=Halorientalis salina TaxID=2932266 RepID=UPI0010AC922F|nr:DICT sensory domain-containing protein [Halorientalis salina]
MDLRETIELIRTLEKELALFNIDASDSIHEQLQTFFETQNVRISSYQTPSGSPRDIAVLSTDEEVLALVAVETLRKLVNQSPSSGDATGVSDAEYEHILGHLKETTFTSFNTEQMHHASREIEDRARRIGSGTIHAGFQQCSLMTAQQEVYTTLAQHGLKVHMYGVPDVTPPAIDGGYVHTAEIDEIAQMWFVVFDGGGNETQKCALLAEERDKNSFYGTWTYDAKIVDSVLTYLHRTYVTPDDTCPQTES